MDLRLRERRFLPPFFALRLAERRAAFFLPPFLAEAFLREERLLGAMVSPTEDYGIETRCCKLDNRERHKQTMHNRNSNGPKIFFKNYFVDLAGVQCLYCGPEGRANDDL